MAPLTYEQRVELLKKAREAKKNKKLAKQPATNSPIEEDDEPEYSTSSVTEKPKKTTRAKKEKEQGRTLELLPPESMPDFVDSEPEIEEQIIYKPKDKKKKKIIRKVIVEASSSDEEVEVVEERVKAPKKPSQRSVSVPPPTSKTSASPFFNF